MSTGIEKYRLENKVRLLFFKYRGDIEKIAAEGNVPIEYVQKIVAKIKRRQKRDVDYWIASTITEYIMMGIEQRTQCLSNLLNELMAEKSVNVSMCCGYPVNEHKWDDEKHYICQKCDKDCAVTLVDRRNFIIIHKTIELLRQEQESVVDFMTKFGYTNKEDTPVNKITQFNIVAGGALTTQDKKLLGDVSELDPRTREKLRKDLERQIIESGFTDEEKK